MLLKPGKMKNISKIGALFGLVFIFVLTACKNDNPSVIKVFVRDASNALVTGAKVVIIGDQQSNPPTSSYVDTVVTNASGYSSFNMDEFYTATGSDETTGYFDIVVKKDAKTAQGYIRSRVHTTAVETVYLPN